MKSAGNKANEVILSSPEDDDGNITQPFASAAIQSSPSQSGPGEEGPSQQEEDGVLSTSDEVASLTFTPSPGQPQQYRSSRVLPLLSTDVIPGTAEDGAVGAVVWPSPGGAGGEEDNKSSAVPTPESVKRSFLAASLLTTGPAGKAPRPPVAQASPLTELYKRRDAITQHFKEQRQQLQQREEDELHKVDALIRQEERRARRNMLEKQSDLEGEHVKLVGRVGTAELHSGAANERALRIEADLLGLQEKTTAAVADVNARQDGFEQETRDGFSSVASRQDGFEQETRDGFSGVNARHQAFEQKTMKELKTVNERTDAVEKEQSALKQQLKVKTDDFLDCLTRCGNDMRKLEQSFRGEAARVWEEIEDKIFNATSSLRDNVTALKGEVGKVGDRQIADRSALEQQFAQACQQLQRALQETNTSCKQVAQENSDAIKHLYLYVDEIGTALREDLDNMGERQKAEAQKITQDTIQQRNQLNNDFREALRQGKRSEIMRRAGESRRLLCSWFSSEHLPTPTQIFNFLEENSDSHHDVVKVRLVLERARSFIAKKNTHQNVVDILADLLSLRGEYQILLTAQEEAEKQAREHLSKQTTITPSDDGDENQSNSV
ncbi:unnamed protein product [Amoebophrya sp. A120]|nr:unnamed protein product [Amoebophrya sp. A120]|eukprot:GSA120T00026075001.1